MSHLGNTSITIVMYHYVRDARKTDFSGIHALHPDTFRAQLEFIKNTYTVVSANTVFEALEGVGALPKNTCVLSFDDGLLDHYETVFPLLKTYKMSGIFFPITVTLEGKVADVNKNQFLLARLGTEKYIAIFEEFIQRQYADEREKYAIPRDKKINPRYRFDDVVTANFKTIMQTLPNDLRSEFLAEAFHKAIGNEKDFARELYLGEGHIKEMHDYGMVIGSHTHLHNRLDLLNKEDQHKELKVSKAILEKVTGSPIHIISYPYGRYNDDTLELSSELGYSGGLGTDVGINTGTINKWALLRINANDIKV